MLKTFSKQFSLFLFSLFVNGSVLVIAAEQAHNILSEDELLLQAWDELSLQAASPTLVDKIETAKPSLSQLIEECKKTSVKVKGREQGLKLKEIKVNLVFHFSEEPGAPYDLMYRDPKTRDLLTSVEASGSKLTDSKYLKAVSSFEKKYPNFERVLKKILKRFSRKIKPLPEELQHRDIYFSRDNAIEKYKNDFERKKRVFIINGTSILAGSALGILIGKSIVPKIFGKISELKSFQELPASKKKTLEKTFSLSFIGISGAIGGLAMGLTSNFTVNQIEDRFILQ